MAKAPTKGKNEPPRPIIVKKITVVAGGHPWKTGVANNWSLSAGRAEATRQTLMRQGIGEKRFRRIEGVADREPLIEKDPADPRNRRMSILVNY